MRKRIQRRDGVDTLIAENQAIVLSGGIEQAGLRLGAGPQIESPKRAQLIGTRRLQQSHGLGGPVGREGEQRAQHRQVVIDVHSVPQLNGIGRGDNVLGECQVAGLGLE